MKQLSFRFAEADDSKPFAEWASTNPNIPQKDLAASLKAENPTSVTIVVEDENGVPQMFCPVWAVMRIGFLGFNPQVTGKDRLRAMELMQKAIAAFAKLHGVNEVTVETMEKYPVAQWALKHDFELEPRQTLKLDVRKVLTEAA